MNFTNFTNNKQANQDLTLFYNWLNKLYGVNDFLDHFALSGQAGFKLQESDFTPIKNVTFITDSEAVMDVLRNELFKEIKTKGVMHFENNSYYIFESIIIDVFYTTDTLTLVGSSGFICQIKTEIPNFLK